VFSNSYDLPVQKYKIGALIVFALIKELNQPVAITRILEILNNGLFAL